VRSSGAVSDDAGRIERFRAIYDANYAAILGYALRRAPHDDALDVVAESFLVAWRRLDDVPVGDDARLWLYATARRVLSNRARSQRRRERLAARLRDRSREQGREPELERGRVASAFGRLSVVERELLALVAWEGLSTTEVARVLGCSTNAVRIRLYRARRNLARELEARSDDLDANPRPLPHVS